MKSLPALSNLLKVTLVAAVCATAPSLFGQNVAVRITAEEPRFDDLPSPNVGGNTGQKNFKPKDWLEVEVKVKLEAKPVPRDKHIDRLTVRWFVAVENKIDRAGAKFFLMEKQVTHVNVPIDEEFFLSCYLSPATLKRLTGRDRAAKNSITAIGGEISCPGAQRPERFTSKGDISKPWWSSPQMQRTNKYPLLNKNETPFKFLWWDRYLEIEPEQQ